jgi:peptide/nickel transport system permease protein
MFRTAATALDDVRHADHVRTARAKGLTELIVARRHIFPNAAPSLLAGFALATRGALSSLAIVEYVFTWHGAGFAFIQSVATANVTLAAGIAVAFVAAFITIERAAYVGARVVSPGRTQ